MGVVAISIEIKIIDKRKKKRQCNGIKLISEPSEVQCLSWLPKEALIQQRCFALSISDCSTKCAEYLPYLPVKTQKHGPLMERTKQRRPGKTNNLMAEY